MNFLHPEFLLWLLVPTLILFYFWLTQKPLQNRWLSEKVLEKLRAPETTMGLKGRNTMFLIAALSLIVAMAQPVILESQPIEGRALHIIIAIDRGGENFEQIRPLTLSTLYSVLGEKIELIAFDDTFLGIAPCSNDGKILEELIKHLSPSSKRLNKSLAEEKLLSREADMKMFVTSASIESEDFFVISSQEDIIKVHEKLLQLKALNRQQVHIPLFFYPLGLAMGLILFAFSSMSKRQSVSVGVVFFVLNLYPLNSHAGILDFQELNAAKRVYESGEYEKAERLFAHHQMKHDSPQVRYNRANALYMSGAYERARYWYEKVYTTDPILRERTRQNLQQSIAKMKRGEIKKRDRDEAKKEINSTPSQSLLQTKREKRATRLFKW